MSIHSRRKVYQNNANSLGISKLLQTYQVEVTQSQILNILTLIPFLSSGQKPDVIGFLRGRGKAF